MDYYWMMGDNRHKSADSRSWGLYRKTTSWDARCLFGYRNKDKSLFGGKSDLTDSLKSEDSPAVSSFEFRVSVFSTAYLPPISIFRNDAIERCYWKL